MATEIEVTMLFTRDGIPATDINSVTPGFPTVRIWNITDGTNSLVVDNAPMTSVIDGADNDGFYKYVFNVGAGFDETQKYVCLFDAGTSIKDIERYNNGQIMPDYGNEILDGQTGLDTKLDTIDGKIDNLNTEMGDVDVKVDAILSLTTYLRKFESNRTLVNVGAGELIVYDDDCSTVLWKFRLLDENGQPDVQSIAERLPLTGGSAPWNTCA
jgi:hypothetical protein